MAELTRPFPPGDYPLVIVGSGAGGLQLSYFLRRLGVRHAVISGDEAAAGMFRRFPLFQRLITWSKRHAPEEDSRRPHDWYDWNSLLADDASHRALVPDFMEGGSIFPSRVEMEAGITAFTQRNRLEVRYGCRWEATRRTPQGFTLITSDGEYRCRIPVFALGAAHPWKPDIPGIQSVPHYAATLPAREYAGQRIFILGKRNSAFELADALHPWARQIVIASPRPVVTSLAIRSPAASVRARYVIPLEDHLLGGGTYALDAAIDRIERRGDGWRVIANGTGAAAEQFVFDADAVIAATGFTTLLQDLRELGLTTFSNDRIPVLTPYFESTTVPGLYFGGALTMGAVGLRKYGLGSMSGGVAGFRHNMRILARHLAETYFGIEIRRRELRPEEAVEVLTSAANGDAALWNQRAYLAHAISVLSDGRLLDQGIVPLQHFVDSSTPDALAVSVETDDQGEHRPALYVRRGGSVAEVILPGHPLLTFDTQEHRRRIGEVLKSLLPPGALDAQFPLSNRALG